MGRSGLAPGYARSGYGQGGQGARSQSGQAGGIFPVDWEGALRPSDKKKRKDPGEGKRIDVSQGATVSVQIAKDEIIRVAQGRDIEIFYQGRKVAPKTIESGAWTKFVPHLPDGAIGRSN